MDSTTCPKCGAAECKESHAHTFEGKARCWEVLAKRYLARAEKAEALAQYRLTRNAELSLRLGRAEVLADYRLDALIARDNAAIVVVEPVIGMEPNGDDDPMEILGDEETWCLYRSCGGGPNEHGPKCPTVTHPKEGPNENA